MNKKEPLSLILFVVVCLFSGCTDTLVTFESVGAKDPVTVPRSTHTNILLIFNVNIGSITLEVNPTATYLAYIENEVSIREGSGGTLADAEEVSYTELDAVTMRIKFNPLIEALQDDYQYDITINVANNVTLELTTFKVTTGTISIDISDNDNDDDNSITILDLNLETTTGSISLELDGIEMSDLSPTVTTTTGDQSIDIVNVDFSLFVEWSITVTTGDVNFCLTEFRYPPEDISEIYEFDIECTTGSILAIIVLGSNSGEYGLALDASTITGNIIVEDTQQDSPYEYVSTNFDSVDLRYEFNLRTTTGEIRVNYTI
jgi:hypothetical protein